MRILLAQTNPVLGDIDANLADAAERVARARDTGASLVVFPELAACGYAVGEVEADLDMSADDPRLLAVAAEAGDGGVLLGFQEGGGVHSYNAAAYYEAGQLVHVHRKLFLPTWGPFEERKHFNPGQAMRAFPTALGRMATLVCNDAWQPMLPFLAVQDGARALLVPTNSSVSHTPHRWRNDEYWGDITRFYARMYQCFVVFCNRVGSEGPLTFWGGSHVRDPYGELLGLAPHGEVAELKVDLDPTAVRRRRREAPLVKEARLALLAREISRLADEGGDL